MVWRVSVLVFLAWVGCGFGPIKQTEACDVEALRCDVICYFPDLTQHCNHCVRRRPMRFGKRGDANAPAPEYMSSKPMRFGKRGDATATAPELPGFKPMRFGKRGGGGGDVSQEEMVHMPIYRHPGLPKPPKANQDQWNIASQRAIDGLIIDSLRKDKQNQMGSNEYDNEVPAIRPQDAWGLSPETLKSKASLGSLHKYLSPASRHTRQRRSNGAVREMVSSLMDLLGLEELPVDPSEYGCHELTNSLLL